MPPFQLQPRQFSLSLESHACAFADHTRSLLFPEALKKWQNGQFIPMNGFKKPGKFHRGAYNFWVRFEVENSSNDTLYTMFQASFDSIWLDDTLALAYTVYPTKDPFGILSSGQRSSIFVATSPGSKHALFCKISSPCLSADFAPKASDLEALEGNLAHENTASVLLHGIGMGSLLLILIFALWHYFQNRDKTYLWYSLFCLSLLAIGWRSLERLDTLFFSTHYLLMWEETKLLQTVAMFVTYIQFVRYFVSIPERHARLDRALRLFIKICLLACVVELVLLNVDRHWSYCFYWWFRLGCAVFCMSLQGWLWQLRDTLSRFVIAGALSLLFWELVSAALPASFDFELANIGIFMENLFLIAGLAWRQKMWGKEHERLNADFILQLKENQKLEREKERNLANERDRIASEMHDDLGAGLSTIRFLSLLAKEKESDPANAGRIDKIAHTASGIMEKMADIIWVMNSRNDSLTNFAAYIRRYAGDYFDTHGIRFSFEMPKPLPDLTLSGEQRRTLLLAVKECLHNVVKHAAATEVHLGITLNGQLEIIIRDNGQGIRQELLKQFENEGNLLTGNGLHNLRHRMEALGGELALENKTGTTVRLKTGIGYDLAITPTGN